jgi:localization factor PodJL
MKPAVAWNVKGVGYDARESAREAARRAGLSVGEWLNSVILDNADERADEQPRRRTPPQRLGLPELHAQLDAMASRLGQTVSCRRDRPRPQDDDEFGDNLRGLETWLAGLAKDLARCSEETPQRVADAILRLNERLDQLITSGRSAASEFERRVAAVDHALDDLNGEDGAPAQDRWPDPAAGAVREIKSRQRALDEIVDDDPRPAADLPAQPAAPAGGLRMEDLDRQLLVLSRQLDMMRRPCAFEESVAALRQDLGNIGDALTKAMPRCALDALESEVHSLADRVGRGRNRGSDPAALSAIEQRLGKVNDLLSGLTPAENIGGFEAAVDALSRKIDKLASSGPDVAALEHLETAIAELRGLTGRVASGEALTLLAREVSTLAQRMDRMANGPVNEAVASLERRVEALSEQITTRAAEAGQAVPGRLEALIGALTAQLERLDLGQGTPVALGHIEAQLGKLGEKIDASDARLSNVEMIERGLADVFLQIEEARANAIEAGEFKRDLADLRMSQSEVDRRTQETLGTVQDTIERLASRLETMETKRVQPPIPSVAPATPANAPTPTVEPPPAPQLPPLAVSPSVAPQPQPPRSMAGPLPGAASMPPRPVATAPASPPRPPIAPGLPADHPLEPGSTPRGRAATPAERIAASEAALAPLKQAAKPEPATEKANFIAAARRAAQAAVAEAAAGGRRASEPADAGAATEGEKPARLKRPLFMSVAAAVLIVGAAHVTLSALGTSRQEPTQTASPAAEPTVDIAAPVNRDSASAFATIGVGTPIPAGAPVPDNRLLAPAPVASTPTAPPSDITGSVAKPQGNAAVESTPAPPAAAIPPASDGLPAGIGGPELRAAAASGNPAAAYEIAVRFAEGRGVAQSFSEAARWFERAADHGLAPAQYRLGSLYEKGHGVKKDLETARRLYVAASEKGNAKAMHNLAVLFAEGIDGKPDYKIASQWFRRAALHGLPDSQFNLGILYAKGIGVEQNLAESYKWFALAAQQGDQDAGRKRDDVAGRLDPQSLVAAKLAAHTFTIKPQPEEATTVKAPGGGWDRPAAQAAPTPAKPKAPARRSSAI